MNYRNYVIALCFAACWIVQVSLLGALPLQAKSAPPQQHKKHELAIDTSVQEAVVAKYRALACAAKLPSGADLKSKLIRAFVPAVQASTRAPLKVTSRKVEGREIVLDYLSTGEKIHANIKVNLELIAGQWKITSYEDDWMPAGDWPSLLDDRWAQTFMTEALMFYCFLFTLMICFTAATISWIWLAALAFKVSAEWGLGCLVVPGVALIFGATHWKSGQKPVMTTVFSLIIGAICIAVPSTYFQTALDALTEANEIVSKQTAAATAVYFSDGK